MADFESPESKKELSEHQKEILEGLGVESVERLKEEIADLEGDKREGEADEEFETRKSAVEYYKQALKDLQE